MREDDVQRSALRRLLRSLHLGLVYMGAGTWPCPEVYDALRSSAGRDRRQAPERITAYDDLPDEERRLLLRLEAQFKHENER
ncbi:hypothetical protein GCM10023195_30080 [Actinoallomurus liliacearum]|uniref:Uncharacterized protein n=1 Tax=Actinoallomurus liliacearum TaxID=1080073 RepID=A0ABP8TJ27_9ACTN